MALALAPVWACGSSSSPGAKPRVAQGPDAAIARQAESAGPLQWAVVRPVHDPERADTIDPRIAVSVLDPESATWLATARLDREGGLSLVKAMQQSLLEIDQGAPHRFDIETVGELPAADGIGRRIIPGGRWRWDGLDVQSSVLVMTLVNDQGDPLVVVRMDPATAASLYRRLGGMVRTAPSKIASVEDLESPQ